jgi:hypothetical protein
MSPHLQFLLGWCGFGLFAVIALASVVTNVEHHRRFVSLFLVLVFLLGPLILVLAVIPKATVLHYSTKGREWLDAHDPEETEHGD